MYVCIYPSFLPSPPPQGCATNNKGLRRARENISIGDQEPEDHLHRHHHRKAHRHHHSPPSYNRRGTYACKYPSTLSDHLRNSRPREHIELAVVGASFWDESIQNIDLNEHNELTKLIIFTLADQKLCPNLNQCQLRFQNRSFDGKGMRGCWPPVYLPSVPYFLNHDDVKTSSSGRYLRVHLVHFCLTATGWLSCIVCTFKCFIKTFSQTG